jgi:predicted nucleic acid-binding protein
VLLDYPRGHPGAADLLDAHRSEGKRWHPLDTEVIAATATLLDARLLTMNVRHFPMFPGLAVPY